MCDFKVNKKSCSVTLENECLVVEQRGNGKTTENRTIFVKDILGVNYVEKKCPSVQVHHVVRHTNKRLRVRTCVIAGDSDACMQLQENLQTQVSAVTRPKRLLVFVNPKSGHRKGEKIFGEKVLPLFELAGIHVDLKVTSRPGESKELLKNYDLSLIHGIVSVGGDGMFSECVNGLLERLQRDSDVNMDDPDNDVTPSNIPIGIVPAGSGNYLVNYIHGTRDMQTAVLKIILGDHHMSNVVSVHQGQSLTCYASLLVEFGLIGDMMHDCEKYRWLGPTRYSVVPFATFAHRKTVDVQVEYLPEERLRKPSPKYNRQASVPANQIASRFLRHRINSMPGEAVSPRKAEWRKVEGAVYGVDSYVVTQKEKQGALVPRFADSALTVWMTDKCGLPDHVEQLTRLQKAKAGFLDFDFVRHFRTSRFRVTLSSAPVTMDANGTRHLDKDFFINADGEAIRLDSPHFEIKLHHAAMPIYGKADG